MSRQRFRTLTQDILRLSEGLKCADLSPPDDFDGWPLPSEPEESSNVTDLDAYRILRALRSPSNTP